jgi:hypothetical protein
MNNDKSVDALCYSRILLEDLAECSRCFGLADEYMNAVNRLRHDCVNMREGPQLKNMIDSYIHGRWNELLMKDYGQWRRDNPLASEHVAEIERGLIMSNHMVELCDFIRQLLTDCDCIRNFYSGGDE